MIDRVALRLLLKEIDIGDKTVSMAEEAILNMFDDVVDELNNDIDALQTSAFKLEAELADLREQTQGLCHWRLTEDDWNRWAGDCGMDWIFPDSTPKENGMVYCPKCGRELEQIDPEPLEVE